MKILAIDSSAKTASVAVTEGGRLISECFVNAALTHSRTLMPMVDNALTQADMSFADIDALSVNVGPGSFTGIRIGVAAVKGLALSGDKPCAGVSTLLSAAYNFADDDCLVCVAMDARCNQVYTALFECLGGKVARICEDKAVPIAELEADLAGCDKKYILQATAPSFALQHSAAGFPPFISPQRTEDISALTALPRPLRIIMSCFALLRSLFRSISDRRRQSVSLN